MKKRVRRRLAVPPIPRTEGAIVFLLFLVTACGPDLVLPDDLTGTYEFIHDSHWGCLSLEKVGSHGDYNINLASYYIEYVVRQGGNVVTIRVENLPNLKWYNYVDRGLEYVTDTVIATGSYDLDADTLATHYFAGDTIHNTRRWLKTGNMSREC